MSGRAELSTGRLDLIRLLGGHCVKCGTTERLEVDHPDGRDYEPKKLGRAERLRRYHEDAASGRVSVLCRRCNAADGARRKRECRERRNGRQRRS